MTYLWSTRDHSHYTSWALSPEEHEQTYRLDNDAYGFTAKSASKERASTFAQAWARTRRQACTAYLGDRAGCVPVKRTAMWTQICGRPWRALMPSRPSILSDEGYTACSPPHRFAARRSSQWGQSQQPRLRRRRWRRSTSFSSLRHLGTTRITLRLDRAPRTWLRWWSLGQYVARANKSGERLATYTLEPTAVDTGVVDAVVNCNSLRSSSAGTRPGARGGNVAQSVDSISIAVPRNMISRPFSGSARKSCRRAPRFVTTARMEPSFKVAARADCADYGHPPLAQAFTRKRTITIKSTDRVKQMSRDSSRAYVLLQMSLRPRTWSRQLWIRARNVPLLDFCVPREEMIKVRLVLRSRK